MTIRESDAPYVYQPFGALSDPDMAARGRLWGVSGILGLRNIKGLTREEADELCAWITARMLEANP